MAQRGVLELALRLLDSRDRCLDPRRIVLVRQDRLSKLDIRNADQFAVVAPLLIVALLDRLQLLFLLRSQPQLRVDPMVSIAVNGLLAGRPARGQQAGHRRDNGRKQ